MFQLRLSLLRSLSLSLIPAHLWNMVWQGSGVAMVPNSL